MFEEWVFVIRLIFLHWVLAPTILLIFFCDLSARQVIFPPDPVQLDDAGFSFGHVDGDECLAVFMGITSNAIGLSLIMVFIVSALSKG
jgi:hypothetical protein